MIADVTLVQTRVIILNFLQKDWLKTQKGWFGITSYIHKKCHLRTFVVEIPARFRKFYETGKNLFVFRLFSSGSLWWHHYVCLFVAVLVSVC